MNLHTYDVKVLQHSLLAYIVLYHILSLLHRLNKGDTPCIRVRLVDSPCFQSLYLQLLAVASYSVQTWEWYRAFHLTLSKKNISSIKLQLFSDRQDFVKTQDVCKSQDVSVSSRNFSRHNKSCTLRATCVSCTSLLVSTVLQRKQVLLLQKSTLSLTPEWKRLRTVFFDVSLSLFLKLWRMVNLTPCDSYLLQFPAVSLLEISSSPHVLPNPGLNWKPLLRHFLFLKSAGNFHHPSRVKRWVQKNDVTR